MKTKLKKSQNAKRTKSDPRDKMDKVRSERKTEQSSEKGLWPKKKPLAEPPKPPKKQLPLPREGGGTKTLLRSEKIKKPVKDRRR